MCVPMCAHEWVPMCVQLHACDLQCVLDSGSKGPGPELRGPRVLPRRCPQQAGSACHPVVWPTCPWWAYTTLGPLLGTGGSRPQGEWAGTDPNCSPLPCWPGWGWGWGVSPCSVPHCGSSRLPATLRQEGPTPFHRGGDRGAQEGSDLSAGPWLWPRVQVGRSAAEPEGARGLRGQGGPQCSDQPPSPGLCWAQQGAGGGGSLRTRPRP